MMPKYWTIAILIAPWGIVGCSGAEAGNSTPLGTGSNGGSGARTASAGVPGVGNASSGTAAGGAGSSQSSGAGTGTAVGGKPPATAGGGPVGVAGGSEAGTGNSGGAGATGVEPVAGKPGTAGAAGKPNGGNAGAGPAGAAGKGTAGSPGAGAAGKGGAGAGGSGPVAGAAGALPKFVGNITTGNNEIDTAGKTYSHHWNQITPENAGKWGSVQSTPTSAFNWKALDAIHDYTVKNGVIFKQHCFLWGAQQPEPQANITEAQVKAWMQAFCSRYPDTRLIDVVNEPPPHTTPQYANAIGGGTNGDWKWIANAFKWAREYCPNATLILNDYNNIEYSDQTDHFIDIVKKIKAGGAPIDAVGAQSHGLANLSTDNMKNLLNRMNSQTGLPVYITEYDIGLADDTAQLNKYKDHFAFFLNTEYIKGITVWGWISGKTWVANTGIMSATGTPRPAFTWLMTTLNRPTQ